MRDAVVKIADFAAGAFVGFYVMPNAQLGPDLDSDRKNSDGDRKNSEVLENALRLEDDAFLRARYAFYLALSLKNEGEGGKALAFSEEAVRLHRKLGGHNADAFLPELASALDNLSHTLCDSDRREEALAASEEAVRLYRKSTATSDAFAQEFVAALDNLSHLLSNVARHEEALAASEEARRIRGADASG
jgi:tetratricopeptide (TPR) repeat protein